MNMLWFKFLAGVEFYKPFWLIVSFVQGIIINNP